MRNRLNLARSLVHDPELLYLDEPTGGLDPVNAAGVRGLVAAANASGATVFLTTHDMTTAAELCDRVAFVVDGRIAACDAPRSLAMIHGRRTVRVEHRVDGQTRRDEFPLGSLPPELASLLASDAVESIHSSEAGLDEVFATVTGHTL